MTDAKLIFGDARRPAIRLERHLPDPPPVVWRALTERERLRSWFPSDVVVSGGRWEAGTEISFSFPQAAGLTLTGRVLEVDEPRLLAFTWGDETLRFELSPEGEGTHLILIDELPPSAAARNAAGWDACLDHLAGLDPAPHAWQPRFRAYTAAFEPVIGPQEGPPAGYTGDRTEHPAPHQD